MNQEIIKKASPFMMEAHRNSWLLVMESEKLSSQEVSATVDSLFSNAIKFSLTIDDHRVDKESSHRAGEVTALRTLVDYVFDAEKKGENEALATFYQKINAAVKSNEQFRRSIVSLLEHFSFSDSDSDLEYANDLLVLKRILG
jgi:hypothetical protein